MTTHVQTCLLASSELQMQVYTSLDALQNFLRVHELSTDYFGAPKAQKESLCTKGSGATNGRWYYCIGSELDDAALADQLPAGVTFEHQCAVELALHCTGREP